MNFEKFIKLSRRSLDFYQRLSPLIDDHFNTTEEFLMRHYRHQRDSLHRNASVTKHPVGNCFIVKSWFSESGEFNPFLMSSDELEHAESEPDDIIISFGKTKSKLNYTWTLQAERPGGGIFSLHRLP